MPPEVPAILSMIGTILLMVAVFVGAYYVSKVVGKQYQNQGPYVENGIEIIERKVVGKDQSLLTVRVAERVFLLGATPHSVEKLEELDPTFFIGGAKAEGATVDFRDVWKNVTGRIGKETGRRHDNGKQ